MKNRTFLAILTTFIFLSCTSQVMAAFANISIISYSDQDYSDIWLGISTGGYGLMAQRGNDYVFRIFVKNGMAERSLNNVVISSETFPFKINSITPKKIEQIKPMEIVIYNVNITVPNNATQGKYPFIFDVESEEFPTGVFKLSEEIKIMKRINVELYAAYLLISIILLAVLFYRKRKIALQDKNKSKKSE